MIATWYKSISMYMEIKIMLKAIGVMILCMERGKDNKLCRKLGVNQIILKHLD